MSNPEAFEGINDGQWIAATFTLSDLDHFALQLNKIASVPFERVPACLWFIQYCRIKERLHFADTRASDRR
jgi:hypothetical protein